MRVAIIAATAALGGLLFGYDTGVISSALLFLRVAFHLSSLMVGVVTSIALAGAAGGAAIAGRLADRFGRRPVLLATSAVFVVGALVSALAGSLTLFLAGRLLVGVGIGGASMSDTALPCRDRPCARAGRAGVVQSACRHLGHPRFLPGRLCLGRQWRMAMDARPGRGCQSAWKIGSSAASVQVVAIAGARGHIP